MQELIAYASFVFGLGRPRDNHRIAGAAEVARNLFGPLERPIQGMSSSAREVTKPFWATDFIDTFQIVFPVFGKAIKKEILIEAAF